MTFEDLKTKLKGLKEKQYLPLTYGDFAEAFPPGAKDSQSQEQANRLAKSLNLRVRYLPEDEEVHFIRN